jgi:hypothetical protein
MDESRASDDQQQRRGISSTGIVLIVLGSIGLVVVICAGLIVVCLVAITALGTSANKTFGSVSGAVASQVQPMQAAQRFINDLGAGLTQSAWDQTSADFHNRHIKAAGPDQSKYFADFLDEHPGLKNPATIEMKSQNPDPSQSTIHATITSKAGEKTVLSLKLKLESGTWKIDDLSVVEEGTKKRN